MDVLHSPGVPIKQCDCGKPDWRIEPTAEFLFSSQTSRPVGLDNRLIYQMEMKAAQEALLSKNYLSAKHRLQKVRGLSGFRYDPQAMLLWQQLYIHLPSLQSGIGR